MEKLVGKVVFKAARTLFLPVPLRIAYTVWQALPYVFRGLKSLLRGKLRVEVLDGLSIGISIARLDFDTASSVMSCWGWVSCWRSGPTKSRWTTWPGACP